MKHFSIICFSILLTTACQHTGDKDPDTPASSQVEVESPQIGGLALYTLRDTLGKNPKEVLREVAAIGYKYIEAAGYSDGKFYGMTPAEFKATLAEVGLEPISSHQGGVTLDNADEMIAAVKAAGFKYFVIPVPPMGLFSFDAETRTLTMSEDLDEVARVINTIAEKCAAAGLQCLYHNHEMEFRPNSKGIVPIDHLIENSNPDHLGFQMDMYWVARAEADPVTYFNKAPGRFKSWHVKDMDEQGRFAPVGKGSINFAEILKHKDKAGLEYYFVEQDRTFDQTPLEAIKISHEALGQIGFK